MSTEKLFSASLEQFRGRLPVMLTFVNQINKRSENEKRLKLVDKCTKEMELF